MLGEARQYVFVDMFYYSDFLGTETIADRYLSAELTQKLIAKKVAQPDITIQVITDPLNILYGGHRSSNFDALEAAGIPVVITNLKPLRDSNPAYSALWRTFLQWFGNSDRPGYLPNVLDHRLEPLGLRTYLAVLNYKANHRKVVVADYEKDGRRGLATLITSANPHDGSSAHSNVALRVTGALAYDVVKSEAAVAAFSGHEFVWPEKTLTANPTPPEEATVTVQLVTEEAIKEAVLATLEETTTADQIDLAMFYIADRDIMRALRAADARGVTIRLLFDPNKDAFGLEEIGIPNRPVAQELMSNTAGHTTVRWCNTHGEQCHSKLLLVRKGATTTLIQGSANYTRRNLDNYNLESNVVVTGPSATPALAQAQSFFDEQWSNHEGVEYSLPYEAYANDSWWLATRYHLKEFTGLSRW